VFHKIFQADDEENDDDGDWWRRRTRCSSSSRSRQGQVGGGYIRETRPG
jgi:hypothetical protein